MIETRCKMPLGHVTPVLASHDTDSIVNSTIEFASSRWLKWHATWLFQSFNTVSTGINIILCQWHQHSIIVFIMLRQFKQFGTSLFWSCDTIHANSVTNGTIPFVRSSSSNRDATWLFWSCDVNGTSMINMLWQWHQQWHHYICLLRMTKLRCNMVR